MDDRGKIDVDPALLDDNSDYESSVYESDTQSLNTSINQYVLENGRRYHSYYGRDKNLHPVDEIEQNRLDLTHELYRLILGERFYKAPIGESPQRILDVGTGTGIWAVDMADQFPGAEVIGVDLSPIQPFYVPPNCRFEVDDLEQDWTYPPENFDFIHARNVAQGFADWNRLLTQMKRCVTKGGWVELFELGSTAYSDDESLKDDSGMKRCCDLLTESMTKIGRPFPVPGTLKQKLEEAGFVDVKEHRYKQPIGMWPRDKKLKMIGGMAMVGSEAGIESYCLAAFTRILGMDVEQSKALMEQAVRDIKNPKIHCWTELFVAYGRKP